LVAEAADSGLPVQRPLFLHFEEDAACYAIQDAYLYGADLLVAPVWQAGAVTRTLHLPGGADWCHIWSGQVFSGGQDITIDAPLGSPAVFYRSGSAHTGLFNGLRDLRP
jgi:alpha-glucosidase